MRLKIILYFQSKFEKLAASGGLLIFMFSLAFVTTACQLQQAEAPSPEIKNSVAETSPTPQSNQNAVNGLPKSFPSARNKLAVNLYLIKPNGVETEVLPSHVFRGGDEMRFGITSSQNGILYIIAYNELLKVKIVYPMYGKSAEIVADRKLRFPPEHEIKFAKPVSAIMPTDTDRLYFVFVPNESDPLLQEIKTLLSGSKDGIESHAPPVRKLLERLESLAQKNERKSENEKKNVEFVSPEQTLVGKIELYSKP